MNASEMSPNQIEEAIESGKVLICEGSQNEQKVFKRVVGFRGDEDLYLILNDYEDSPYKHPLVGEGVGHLYQLMQMIAPLEKWKLSEPQ